MNSRQRINCCYSGRSKIRCRNIITYEVSDIAVSNITPDIHEVYSADNQKFIPIMCNIVAGITNKLLLIRKNIIAENLPSDDLYIASKHHVFINGIEIFAKNILHAKNTKVKPEMLYTICTQKREAIIINGLEVASWSYEDWLDYSLRKSIYWYSVDSIDNTNIQKKIDNIISDKDSWKDYIINIVTGLFYQNK